MNENKERLGSLWVQESKAGVRYMKGMINVGGQEIKIVIFRNKTKKTDKSPDMSIFESKPFQKSAEQVEKQVRDIF